MFKPYKYIDAGIKLLKKLTSTEDLSKALIEHQTAIPQFTIEGHDVVFYGLPSGDYLAYLVQYYPVGTGRIIAYLPAFDDIQPCLAEADTESEAYTLVFKEFLDKVLLFLESNKLLPLPDVMHTDRIH